MPRFLSHAKPLHIALAALMLGLVIIFYLSLASVALYLGEQRDLRVANDKVVRVGHTLKGVFDSELMPMKSVIKILAETDLVSGKSQSDRLTQLGPMAAALIQNPSAGAVYAGTVNGSFVLMRNLKDRPQDRATFNAPANARFLVQSVNRDAEPAEGRFDFYDDALVLVESLVKPDYRFDPRTRPWYQEASESDGVIETEPYVFASNQKMGITIATRSVNKAGVVGIDMTLTGISSLLERQQVTSSAELVLFRASGTVLAYRDTQKIVKKSESGKLDVVSVPELGVPALTELYQRWKDHVVVGGEHEAGIETTMQVDGSDWYYRVELIDGQGSDSVTHYLGVAVPHAELMVDSIRSGKLSAALSLILMALMVPAVFYLSKTVSRPLRNLVKVAKAIERFDFTVPDPLRSSIAEVDDLAVNMTSMKHTLKRFLDISSALSAESNFQRLINIILRETISISGASGGALVLVSGDGKSVQAATRQLHGVEQDVTHARSYALSDAEHAPLEVQAVAQGRMQSLRINRSTPAHDAVYGRLFKALGADQAHLVALPLRNRANEILGALTLTLEACGDDSAPPLSPALLAFIEALSGTAAVAIDNQRMVLEQKALLESLIHLIAGAIDAKSSYSGGHCQRVPELCKMLAKAACEKTEGPFAGFNLTPEGWETLHIAGWLHDCGKVTTPEFVVDKATKLETIYDRIHEVRMRFEVLKRDVKIAGYEQVLARLPSGLIDLGAMRAQVNESLSTLDDEFKFVATCNIGGEFMAPDKVERLKAIARRQWLRTLDDRLGISGHDLMLRQRVPSPDLPVWEDLLADKPEHITERAEDDCMDAQNPWGFKVPAPAHLYNRGELYNLSIARGTLTNEDRYKINEHIVQTIKMLSALPFPKHLSRVPEIAGGHHEKMDGTGYPRCLSKTDMSVEARMMAVADVFEALTAVDRPYKKGKTLSEAVRIMSFMCKDKHLDSDVFELFLESGAYLEYAHRFMRPEQLDVVDVASYLTGR